MELVQTAQELRAYLLAQPEVTSCVLTGSVAERRHDRYSDIDMEIDVSGHDNSRYALTLPAVMARYRPVIYSDYAPSLMPDSYVVSLALSAENPFLLLDIKCTATPHCPTLQRGDFPYDVFAHTLKLLVLNTKHFLRGADCLSDIRRMYTRLYVQGAELPADEMLRRVYRWLTAQERADCRAYLQSLQKYMIF